MQNKQKQTTTAQGQGRPTYSVNGVALRPLLLEGFFSFVSHFGNEMKWLKKKNLCKKTAIKKNRMKTKTKKPPQKKHTNKYNNKDNNNSPPSPPLTIITSPASSA